MRKRLIAAVLALCLALTLATPVWATEDDVPTSGSCGENATWTLSPDGTLTISGTGGAVKPQGGFPKEVAHAVRSVIIEKGITAIGASMFYQFDQSPDGSDLAHPPSPESDFNQLKTVIVRGDIQFGIDAYGVDEFGPEYVFAGCTSLTDVVFEGELYEVGWGMFSGCTSLKNITLPNSVTRIYYGAFADCTSLESIVIPDSVAHIGGGDGDGEGVFEGCTSLKSVKLPDNPLLCIYGAGSAFADCTSLESIVIPDSVAHIGGGDGDGEGVFEGCTSLKSVKLPDNPLLCIYGAGSAFADCTSLESITFPKNFTMVASNTFMGCTNLKDIYYGGSQMQWENHIISYWGEKERLDTNAKIHFSEITTTDSSCIGSEDGGEDSYNVGELLINNNLDVGDKIIRLGGLAAISMFENGEVPFTLGYLYEEEGTYTGKLSLDEDGKTVLFTADEGQVLPLGFTIRPVTGIIATPIPVVRGDSVPSVADGVAPEYREAALALASSIKTENIINGARVELAQIAEQVAADDSYENPRILVGLKAEVEEYTVQDGRPASFTLNLIPCYTIEGKKDGTRETKELQTKTFLSIDDVPAPVQVELELPEKFALSDDETRMDFQIVAKGHHMKSVRVDSVQRENKEFGSFYLDQFGKYTFVKDNRTLEVTYHFNDKSASVSEYTFANLGSELRTDTKTGATFLGWNEEKGAAQAAYSGKLTEEIFEQMFQKNKSGHYVQYTPFDLYPVLQNNNTSGGGGSGSGGGGSIGGGGGSATTPTKPSTPAQPTTPTKPTTPEQTKPEKPAVNASEKFTDVQEGAWYEQAVNYVLEKGLMQGTGDTTFAPGDTLSRAMLAQILYNNEGKPAAKGESKFTDISGGWYADAVAWAAESGVVTGNADGTFNPNGPITREQIAVILYRYAQQKGYDTGKKADLSAFADADSISDYAKEAMAWANASGFINGMDETTLAPGGSATRAQVAAILMRFLESVK